MPWLFAHRLGLVAVTMQECRSISFSEARAHQRIIKVCVDQIGMPLVETLQISRIEVVGQYQLQVIRILTWRRAVALRPSDELENDQPRNRYDARLPLAQEQRDGPS
jgi:hypothetical protein